MAKKTGKKRFGLSLGAKLFLATGLLILLAVGGAGALTWIYGNRFAAEIADEHLAGSHAVHAAIQQQRYNRLQLIAKILRTDQILISYLAGAAREENQAAIFDAVEEYQNQLTFDLAVVLDPAGRVLKRTDGREASGEDLSASPLIITALAESEAIGVWQQGENLYHAVAVRLARQFELVGVIVVAFAIDDTLALQIQRTSGAEAVFLGSSRPGRR